MTAQDGLEPFTNGDLQRAVQDELGRLERAHRLALEDLRELRKKQRRLETELAETIKGVTSANDLATETYRAYELVVLSEKVPDYIRDALRERKARK